LLERFGGFAEKEETLARTYLFLQMMRLEPANCSGGAAAAAAFFLAIALDG
jgi:hypothetical protein